MGVRVAKTFCMHSEALVSFTMSKPQGGAQVAQRVARKRGIVQRGGKKRKSKGAKGRKPQPGVYLEYPSNPVTADEGMCCSQEGVCQPAAYW